MRMWWVSIDRCSFSSLSQVTTSQQASSLEFRTFGGADISDDTKERILVAENLFLQIDDINKLINTKNSFGKKESSNIRNKLRPIFNEAQKNKLKGMDRRIRRLLKDLERKTTK